MKLSPIKLKIRLIEGSFLQQEGKKKPLKAVLTLVLFYWYIKNYLETKDNVIFFNLYFSINKLRYNKISVQRQRVPKYKVH